MRKVVFVALGLIFFGLGAIGSIIPVLPTTPFLLLAAACFARGSKRFNIWFKNTKLYQNQLDIFFKERAMTLRTKISLCSFASTMMIIAILIVNNIFIRIFILCLIVFKYYYFIFRIKTIKPDKLSTVTSVTDKDELN